MIFIYSGQYNLLDLEQQGYKTIVVELSFDAYEINDGYQYVFIYADDTSSTLITGGGLDIPNGYYSGNPDNYVIYFEAQIASFSYKNYFVVRYGASGSFSDDWKVQNLKVQVGFSFEVMKTSNMWKLIKNADGTHTATII